MADTTQVEKTTRLTVVVNDLAAAWAFIMARLDEVGPNPSVQIHPMWVYSGTDDEGTRKFEVTVSGMTTETKDDDDE